MNEYYSAYPQNDYRYYLQHSAKGTTWGDHKYIAIENGRYIYPEDAKSSGGAGRPRGRQRNITGKATVAKTGNGLGYGKSVTAGTGSKMTDEVWNNRPKSLSSMQKKRRLAKKLIAFRRRQALQALGKTIK